MNEQGLGGFLGCRGAVQQGPGREDAMALLQHQHRRRRQQLEEEEEEEEEEEVRRQMFPAALGHGQQVDYREDAGGLGDSDAGRSEAEPSLERTRGRFGSKRSHAAEVHNLSEKRRNKINEKMKDGSTSN